MSAAINDVAGPLAAEPAPVEPWVEETLDRYMNPIAFSRKNASLPSPQVVGEKVLTSTDGQSVKLTVSIAVLLRSIGEWAGGKTGTGVEVYIGERREITNYLTAGTVMLNL